MTDGDPSVKQRRERDYRESISVARGPLFAIGISLLLWLIMLGLIAAIFIFAGS